MAAGALVAGPADGPLAVLIHGLAGSRRVWDRVLPLIESRLRVHALDLAGGDSIAHDAEQAVELIPGPAVLVGHSRGALVATAIAEAYPGLVRRLILLCPPWSTAGRLGTARLAERAVALRWVGALVWAAATPAKQREALSTAFAPGTRIPDQFVADLRAAGRRTFLTESKAIDTYLGNAALAPRLSACGIPTHVIFGERDTRVAQPPREALPHELLGGIGHTPPWEAPERVAEIITDSLQDRDGDSSCGIGSDAPCLHYR